MLLVFDFNSSYTVDSKLFITYDYLFTNKQEIEQIANIKLSWDRLDDKKASLVCTYINGLDFNKQENYEELMNKVIDTILVLRKAFAQFIKG